jgi:hypothetical protein
MLYCSQNELDIVYFRSSSDVSFVWRVFGDGLLSSVVHELVSGGYEVLVIGLNSRRSTTIIMISVASRNI